MAVNIIKSGFLLLVLAAGVQSAIKELGDPCATGASADTCVSPLAVLVCDAPPSGTGGKCRVKEGQPCKNAGGLCVVGAECVSGSCVCQTGYSPALPSGQCTVPAHGYYSACTDADAIASCSATGLLNGVNTDCSSDGGCECDTAGSTPVPDYVAVGGTCVALVDGRVSRTGCTGTPANCGSGANLVCSSDVCVCDVGYFPTKTPGGTCVANSASTVGFTCNPASNPSECTGVNEECASGATKCTCKTGFTSQPGGVCYAAWGKKQGSCSVDADCTGTAGATKCTSVSSAPKTCKTALVKGAPCTANPTTEACGDGLVCDGTCKTEVDAGGDCTDTATTKCKLHTTCDGTSHKCVVDATYIGGSCTAASVNPFIQGNCQANTLCGAVTTDNGICVCPSGYEAAPAEVCVITAHMNGASCTATTANTKGTCGHVSLVCSATTAGTCGCAPSYSGGSTGGECYSDNSVNSVCSGATCTDTNAECSSGKCKCKSDFTQSLLTRKCVLAVGGSTDCTSQTCVDGSTCDAATKRCKCDGDKTTLGLYCIPTTPNVVFGKCSITQTANTEKGTCTDPNAKCNRPASLCFCNYLDGYTASKFGDTCHASDAMMITTSSLLITLAAVISQLFVR